MRVERALLEELSEKVFNIGYQGELNHTQVIISCPVMFRDYPDAVASMVVKPPQGDLYPVSLTRDGNDLTWDVSASDVAIPGAGILQLTFTDGEGEEAEIIKTVYGSYSVNASLVANGEAPDPVQSWLDEAGAALSTFETEIGEIRKITTATESDEGLALSPKTVVNGKVTEWEYIDLADPEVVTQAIDDWLDDHPEATTTVEDGAITEAKLNSTLVDDLAWQDDLDDVKNALSQSKAPVILDTATGEIVTVPDGADGLDVKKLTVAIEPVQDLHGQSNPYPAGGGKNKLAFTIDNLKTVNTSGTWSGNTYTHNGVKFAVDVDDSGNATGINVSMTATGLAVMDIGRNATTLPAGTYYFPAISATNVGFIIFKIVDGTATTIGGVNQFTLTEETSVFVRVTVTSGNTPSGTIKPIICTTSETETFAPYSNLCPISGWTGANVALTGVNVWDEEWEVGGYSTSTGEKGVDPSRIRCKNKIPCKQNTLYYNNSPQTVIYLFYDCNDNYIDYVGVVSNQDFTTPQNAYYIAFYVASAYGTTYNNDISINYPSTDHDYHPGHVASTSYPFPSQAGTVYGGTLTVNADGTGTLVVDRAKVDLGSLTWTYVNSSDDVRGFYDFILDMIEGKPYAPVISSMYKTGGIKWANISDKEIGTNASGSPSGNTTQIIVKDSSYSDAAVFKQAMTDNNVQAVYELATPVVYNLTVEAVSLLLGVNNLWADCGNVTMQYPCDTKLFIERLTAPTEDDMIANANISSGKFFMVGNNLYISTSAIAQGETITPGTNCTAVSLADALNQINQ